MKKIFQTYLDAIKQSKNKNDRLYSEIFIIFLNEAYNFEAKVSKVDSATIILDEEDTNRLLDL